MGVSVFPAPSAASKTMFRTTLTSGTSYTVPAGVTYLNVTLYGAGGGAGGAIDINSVTPSPGAGGQIVSSTLSATAGASIAYAIGAGGAAGSAGSAGNGTNGSAGGSTTFTGATTASGGGGGAHYYGTPGAPYGFDNGGRPPMGMSARTSGAGGAGKIDIEYWV
jgi:hypothetical protein